MRARPSRIPATGEVRLLHRPRPLSPLRAPARLATRVRCSRSASPCLLPLAPRRARAVTSRGPRPEHPTSAVRTDARAHPTRALDPPPREAAASVRVPKAAARRSRARAFAPSAIKRSSEEPCPLRRSRRPISRPSLSRGSSRGRRHRSEAEGERAGGTAERTGYEPVRGMGRGPEAKARPAILRRTSPLLRAPRTPRVVSRRLLLRRFSP